MELPHYISFYFRSCLKQMPKVKNPSAQAACMALCAAMIEWGDHPDRPAPLDVSITALNSPSERVRETASMSVQIIASKSNNPGGVFHRTLDLADARGRLWIAIFLRHIAGRLDADDAIGLMRRLILDRSTIVQEKAISQCIHTEYAQDLLPTLYEALTGTKYEKDAYWSTRRAIAIVEHGYCFSKDPHDPDRMLVDVLYRTGSGNENEIQSYDILRSDLEELGEARVVEELRQWCRSMGRKHFDWMSR